MPFLEKRAQKLFLKKEPKNALLLFLEKRAQKCSFALFKKKGPKTSIFEKKPLFLEKSGFFAYLKRR
jgi:hypothetical protein